MLREGREGVNENRPADMLTGRLQIGVGRLFLHPSLDLEKIGECRMIGALPVPAGFLLVVLLPTT
jgi:hypothetical protein